MSSKSSKDRSATAATKTSVARSPKAASPPPQATTVWTHSAQTTLTVAIDQWLWRFLAAGMVILPLVLVPGKDGFRLPKELYLIGEGLLAGAYLTSAVIAGRIQMPPTKVWRSEHVLTVMILLWTAATAVVSSNHDRSFHTVIWVTSATAIFVSTVITAPRRNEGVLWLILIPAAINSVLALSQALNIWNPFVLPADISTRLTARLKAIALLGNPDNVGSYIVMPALASLTMSHITRGLTRWTYFIVSCLMIAALIACQLITATVALFSGIVVLIMLVPARRARRILFATILVAGIAVISYTPFRQRITGLTKALVMGNLDTASSSRLPAFLVATEMFLRHPFAGVGPGTFGFNYFDYKIASDAKYGSLTLDHVEIFRDVHNDHLQILATTGAPGYVLMLSCFFLIGRRSFWRIDSASPRRARFVHLFALPFVVCIAVLALGQFPLELGASLSVALTLAAFCVAWLPQ